MLELSVPRGLLFLPRDAGSGAWHLPTGVSLSPKCSVSSPQEWIKDTQNVVPLNKMEGAEHDCGPEEALIVHLATAEAEMPILTTGPSCPQTEEEEASGDPSQLPGQPLQGGGGGERVSLGGFTFVMSDNSYVML